MSRRPAAIGIAALCGLGVYVLRGASTSAHDYYLDLLPDPDFAYAPVPQDELRRIAASRGLGRTERIEMARIARETAPAKQLHPLLDDVLRNMPHQYDRAPDVFAGVYPNAKFNARTLRSPEGGYLILVNYGLKKALWEWGKLVVNVVALQRPAAGLQPDADIETMVEAFVESVLDYAAKEALPAFPTYAADDKLILLAHLHTAALEFILAHEYAHVLLGHVAGSSPRAVDLTADSTGDAPSFYLREYEADELAVELFVGHFSESAFLPLSQGMQVLGVYFGLAVFETLDAAGRAVGAGRGYPELSRRRAAIRELLDTRIPLDEASLVHDFMDAMDFLVGRAIEASYLRSRGLR